jgi:hypothetical protein
MGIIDRKVIWDDNNERFYPLNFSVTELFVASLGLVFIGKVNKK